MTARGRRLAAVLLGVALLGGLAGAPGLAPSATAATPTIAQLIGQKLIVRMEGLTPSASLLGRIRRGEIGGVILFSSNITTAAALRHLTATLHAAAVAGHQPRLLIAVDQEGGSVKRIPWIPPTLSPPRMGALGSTSIARSQGAATGAALRDLGIDVDFAPVADVPASTASFMYRAGRTWSFDAGRTASLSTAFALGLRGAGVIPTLKHFPGIGYATRNTDTNLVRIGATRVQLAPGLRPYRTAIADRLPLIMLSNASYAAYDPIFGGGWAPSVATLLRRDLGYTGATITDSLDGTAATRGIHVTWLALDATRVGTDLILTTGSETDTAVVYRFLVREATAGLISQSTLLTSWRRIQALKATLPAA